MNTSSSPRHMSYRTKWTLVIIFAAISLWRFRAELQPGFPGPPHGYNYEQVDFDAPRFPFVEPYVIPYVELSPETHSFDLGAIETTPDRPIAIAASVRMPAWMWQGGSVPRFGLRVMAIDSRGQEDRMRQVHYSDENDASRQVVDGYLEMPTPKEPGEYAFRVLATHYGFTDLYELSPAPTREEIATYRMETEIAHGVFLVE